MNIVIGADHRGFTHKQYIQQHTQLGGTQKISWIDVGAYTQELSDYPIYAQKASEVILAEKAAYGVLFCATGIGMAISANRYRGIYAALIWNEEVARLSKEHDHANVVVIPADFISLENALKMVSIWLDAAMLSGRYDDRVAMIDRL